MGKVDRAVISLPAVNHMASKDRHKNSVSPVFAGEVHETRKINYVLQIFGECPLIKRFLEAKSERSLWLPIKVLDAVLRGFSQVVFANNSLSGLFIIVGLILADPLVCAAGLLAAFLATVTALVFNQPWGLISNGLVTYNGVLVGTVTASLCPPIVEETNGPDYFVWLLIGLGGIMSALVTSGMANLCSGPSLPAMTVPFNLIDLLLFICLPTTLQHLASSETVTSSPAILPNFNSTIERLNQTSHMTSAPVDWSMVMRGSFVSMGQIYAVESVACSIVMYVGVTLFSPMLSIALYIGSLLASICGLGLTDDFTAIYSGLWGYNAALTAAAIAVTFYIPTVLSAFNAVLAVFFTAAVQRALGLVLAPAGLPVLTLPFVITSSIFLAVTSGIGKERLAKAPDGRPPEYQRKRHTKAKMNSNNPSDV